MGAEIAFNYENRNPIFSIIYKCRMCNFAAIMNTDAMSSQITPYKNSGESKGEQVEKMFDNISGNYDFLNRLITFRMDKRWRQRVLKLIADQNPESILDIATGTGDMAILFASTKATNILGVDISQGMLNVAEEKIKAQQLQNRIKTAIQNSEDLKLGDNSFDVVTVSYGIRNFDNLEKGLSEMFRVNKPGGITVILETSVPSNPIIKAGYLFYTKAIMPNLARLFSKDKDAYKYLSDSAVKFPSGKAFEAILQKVGYKNVKTYPQMGGASSIYYAEK